MAHSSNVPHDEEDGLSILDVIEEEERLEEEAHALLGDSDDKNCTYPLGYISRQALYACSTCSTEGKGPAGVCLACSYECHEGHDLVELYTKRFFRCDCGNSKFPSLKCKLYQSKEKVNSSNKYNQNFDGLYCTCHRPYPDPADDIEDEMIQCVVCEDWYHGRHTDTDMPESHDFSEFVCTDCMKKLDFLWAYSQMSTVTVMKEEETSSEVDVVKEENKCDSNITNGRSPGKKSPKSKTPPDSPGCSRESSNSQTKESLCHLKDLMKRSYKTPEHGAFWPEGWRTKLCQCTDCVSMYKAKDVSYLPDEADTADAYVERGQAKSEPVTQHQKEVKALSQMNRIQQIELIQGYNDMKSQLSEYLRKFAENGKVVKEEDIKEFFSGMQARKRQKTDHGFQYSCK